MTDEEIERAIKVTEYKYFGDYEMSDDQREAVDVLVAAASAAIQAMNQRQIVAWMYEHGGSDWKPQIKLVGDGLVRLTEQDFANGWTETPLYR